MSYDLRDQIREVAVAIEDSQTPILGVDVRSGTVGFASTSDEASRPMRGVTIAATAFAVVMILVGGVAWLAPFGEDATSTDGSTVTTSTTLPATTSSTPAVGLSPPEGDGPILEFSQVELPPGFLTAGIPGAWFKGDLYIAIAGAQGDQLFRSPDGINWESLPTFPGRGNSPEQFRIRLWTDGDVLMYITDPYVTDGVRTRNEACEQDGLPIVLHTTTDGIDWASNRIALPIPDQLTGTGGCYNQQYRVVRGPTGTMITALNGRAWFSPDGVRWTHADRAGPLQDGDDILSVVATTDGFVATGTGGRQVLWETVDGSSWVEGDPLYRPWGLDVWNGQLVLISSEGVSTIEDSPKQLIPSTGMDGVTLIEISDLGLVGVDNGWSEPSTRVLFSIDGSTWSQWTPPQFGTEGSIYMVGSGGDFVVLQTYGSTESCVRQGDTETCDAPGSPTFWLGRLP